MTKNYKRVCYHDGTEFTVAEIDDSPSVKTTCLDGREIELRSVSYPSGLHGLIPEADIASISAHPVEVWDGTR
jgi:hypothetical protein